MKKTLKTRLRWLWLFIHYWVWVRLFRQGNGWYLNPCGIEVVEIDNLVTKVKTSYAPGYSFFLCDPTAGFDALKPGGIPIGKSNYQDYDPK